MCSIENISIKRWNITFNLFCSFILQIFKSTNISRCTYWRNLRLSNFAKFNHLYIHILVYEYNWLVEFHNQYLRPIAVKPLFDFKYLDLLYSLVFGPPKIVIRTFVFVTMLRCHTIERISNTFIILIALHLYLTLTECN